MTTEVILLVLSRMRDEVIEIQDGDGAILAEVAVVDIRGDKVRLGVTAANELPVHRKEVADAIRREKSSATVVKETVEAAIKR